MAKPRVKLPEKDDGFIDLFDGESDRASAVLAASYLEAVLERTLRTWFLDCPEMDRAFDPLQKGFLGDLAAKADLAYGMGILSADLHKEVRLLARIRNHFAHNVLESDSFDVQPVCDHILQLTLTKIFRRKKSKAEFDKMSLRGLYLVAVDLLLYPINAARLAPRDNERIRDDFQKFRDMRVSHEKGIDPGLLAAAIRRRAQREEDEKG